jgi:hypothetical protein
MNYKIEVVTGLLLLCTIGCETHNPKPANNIPAEFYPKIEIGQTTRQDILLTYGAPSKVLKGGKILTFRLRLDKEGLHNTGIESVGIGREFYSKRSMNKVWFVARYNLVVIFNDTGKVEKWQILQVR